MFEDKAGDAATILEFAQKHVKPEIIELSPGVKVAALPGSKGGISLESIKKLVDEYKSGPDRIEGTATLTELASFVAHVDRFKLAGSSLFAYAQSMTNASLTCVYDYHEKTSPHFGRHRAIYRPAFSPEWAAWLGKNNVEMSQLAFAEFIEEHSLDLGMPGDAGAQQVTELARAMDVTLAQPNDVISVSRKFSFNEKRVISNMHNLQSGEIELIYDVTQTDSKGGKLIAPGAFLITIPAFRGAKVLEPIGVRLRYRHHEGKAAWKYSLFQIDRVFDRAFGEACVGAAEKTGLPLFVGEPEQKS